jgi:hypothetical protein
MVSMNTGTEPSTVIPWACNLQLNGPQFQALAGIMPQFDPGDIVEEDVATLKSDAPTGHYMIVCHINSAQPFVEKNNVNNAIQAEFELM